MQGHSQSILRLAVLAGALLAARSPETAPSTRPAAGPVPKNIIVLIADGAGYNMLQATRLWTGQPLTMDDAAWTKLAQATFSLRSGRSLRRDVEALAQDPAMRYDPRRHYDCTPVAGEHHAKIAGAEVAYPRGFAGYELLRRTAPDSAATASAMMTGVATYNGAINVDGTRQPVESVAQVANRSGKRVGVVTSVPWTHATPAAAGGAHNIERGNYHQISREMLSAGTTDVLAGAGNPGFNASGESRSEGDFTFYAPDDWQALAGGTRNDSAGRKWTLVEGPDEIRALAAGATPEKLVIVPRIGWTLQQLRRPSEDRNGDGRHNGADALATAPRQDLPNANVVTLLDLARASLNAIDDDPDGFFMMIEGGAVDWAMHDNQLGRAIEEYIEFNAVVRLVVEYLDAGTNGHSWENTLVVVTADHDHLLYGPASDTIAFQELEDRGPGNMPGHRWLANGHSNNLVPLFARGPGSSRLIELADEMDAWSNGSRQFGRGAYLHQAELGTLLKLLAGQSASP